MAAVLGFSGKVPLVATLLLAQEQITVQAAGEGVYGTLHRECLSDVLEDLRAHRASAVVISIARCGDPTTVAVAAQLVKEFPHVRTLALVTRVDSTSADVILGLGRCGVHGVVDVRDARGWNQLRDALAVDNGEQIRRVALGQLSLDLAGAPSDCWCFFEAIFGRDPRVTSVRRLAEQLSVLPSTLMSRFFRARLPAPKRYLVSARLVEAASLFENPGLSVSSVADALEYSSPQSFGRHVRTMVGMTAVEFRYRYDGEGMVQRFREELILPYVDRLRVFSPLTSMPRWANLSLNAVQ